MDGESCQLVIDRVVAEEEWTEFGLEGNCGDLKVGLNIRVVGWSSAPVIEYVESWARLQRCRPVRPPMNVR